MLDPTLASSSPAAHRMLVDSRRQSREDLQPWTAARCQRLLRQLQIRLSTLRKLINDAQNPAPAQSSKRPGSLEEHPAPKRSRYTYAQRRRAQPQPSKPTENPDTTPPRVVRTLGAMKCSQSSPVSGRIDLSTPMLRKMRDQPSTPDPTPRVGKPEASISPSLISALNNLRQSTPAGHFRTYEGIFHWLSSVLRATETQSPEPHPKSLLGMCLRRIHAVLAEIEAWDRHVAGKAGDSALWNESKSSSLELYGQLEAFGGAATGWKPLKIALRAHAMSMLTSAVAEGLFEPRFVHLLAELCLHLKCCEEAGNIVSHLEGRLTGPQSSTSAFSENTKSQPLCAIIGSLRGKKSPGASFDCLSHLLREKVLPLPWLSTRGFRHVWMSSLEAMTAGGPKPSVLDFMCTALELLAVNEGNERWSRQSNREQTLSSIVSGLAATAIVLVSEGRAGGLAKSKRVYRRIMHALERCIAETRCHKRAARDGGLFILVLARYLILAEVDKDETWARRDAEAECRDVATARGNAVHAHYRQSLVLMCSIAQYRGRACSVPCHDILSDMCDAMDAITFPDWFHVGIRTDGAFVLAQKTKDLRDLAFAERLPAMGADQTGRCEKKSFFSGWRWEEGISEWVVPTPARKKTKTAAGGCGRRRSRRSAGTAEETPEANGRASGHAHGHAGARASHGAETASDIGGASDALGSTSSSSEDSGDELGKSGDGGRCSERASTSKRAAIRGKGNPFNRPTAATSRKPVVVTGSTARSRQGLAAASAAAAFENTNKTKRRRLMFRDVYRGQGPSQIQRTGGRTLNDDWDELGATV